MREIRMNQISKSIHKRDHDLKITGQAIYVADVPTDGMFHAKVLRSSISKGRILSVTVPLLPEGYTYIDHKHVPGQNHVHMILDDTPVFAESMVEYIGDPIGMIVGPDEDKVLQLLEETKVEYEELMPEFDPLQSKTTFFDYSFGRGDTEDACAKADWVVEKTYETGLQEHVPLETNGLIASYDGKVLSIRGSMQCPYYLLTAVAQATGLEPNQISISQDVTGGGFGKKEDYPSVLACQVGVAAMVTGQIIRLIFDREEDITCTSKRHPSYCTYKVAVKEKRITSMDIKVIYDGGAYTTLSNVVLQRGLIGSCGIYYIENLQIHGEVRKTNVVPNGAFRGFGGPQTFFAVEMLMTHIAEMLGMDPITFKLNHVAKQGDPTSTNGKYHFPVPIPEMVSKVMEISDYRRKYDANQNRSNRSDDARFLRGIGMGMVYHGAGFTGSAERDFIKAEIHLRKDIHNKVEILTACTDMGQGIFTTLSKIASKELGIPMEDIIVNLPDTLRVPDSGPTVASRSTMVVGELVRRACIRLKKEWKEGQEQYVEQFYEHPTFLIPFDITTFSGDAYPTYSWAVNCVEVEIDSLTGTIQILGAWGSYDVGTPIDENIVIGQMEGGFLQSIGYGMMEEMKAQQGRIRNCRFSDYLIPTAVDVPKMQVLLHVEQYPSGPYGAKGAGELPNVAAAPAVVEAIQNALGVQLHKTPFLAENVMDVLRT